MNIDDYPHNEELWNLTSEELVFLLYEIIDNKNHPLKQYKDAIKDRLTRIYMQHCFKYLKEISIEEIPLNIRDDMLSIALEALCAEVFAYNGKVMYDPDKYTFSIFAYLRIAYSKGRAISFYTNLTHHEKKDYVTVNGIFNKLRHSFGKEIGEEELKRAVAGKMGWGSRRTNTAVEVFYRKYNQNVHVDFYDDYKLYEIQKAYGTIFKSGGNETEKDYIQSLFKISFEEFYEMVSSVISYEDACFFWFNQVECFQKNDLKITTLKEKGSLPANVTYFKKLNKKYNKKGGRPSKINKSENGIETVTVSTIQRKLMEIKKAILSDEEVSKRLYKRLIEGIGG